MSQLARGLDGGSPGGKLHPAPNADDVRVGSGRGKITAQNFIGTYDFSGYMCRFLDSMTTCKNIQADEIVASNRVRRLNGQMRTSVTMCSTGPHMGDLKRDKSGALPKVVGFLLFLVN